MKAWHSPDPKLRKPGTGHKMNYLCPVRYFSAICLDRTRETKYAINMKPEPIYTNSALPSSQHHTRFHAKNLRRPTKLATLENRGHLRFLRFSCSTAPRLDSLALATPPSFLTQKRKGIRGS